ncbi:MAG: PQQ-dependent sugar dehydrogenase, partial [Akkermansiaceae bacterium]|nr:PQQ-dependent sugar dehydrogenase [Akkermansiaceae bacterium]
GGLLSITFHPDYARNGQFFVYYTVDLDDGNGPLFHDRLSRFVVSGGDPDAADPASGQPLLTQYDQGNSHNGGTLHFGPSDGYLYLSLGDEGGGNDSYNNSQRIDKDFFAGMLRIDVDLEAEDYTVRDDTGSDDHNLRPTDHHAIDLDGNGNPFYEVPADNPFVGA